MFNVKKTIEESVKVYETEFKNDKVDIIITCDKNIEYNGWNQDLITIIVNLLDNSLYWLNYSEKKEIKIQVENKNGLVINYYDSGKGIDRSLLEDDLIFDPEFSTKPEGMGLGLAIAGEAALRNNLKLSAVDIEKGAFFQVYSDSKGIKMVYNICIH